MIRLVINSDPSYARVLGELPEVIFELYDKYKYVEIHINTGKKRSLPQNAIQHVWYPKIEKATDMQQSADEIRRECKLNIGLPIRREDDEQYNIDCTKFIDPLPYHQQLEVMKYWPVTRDMKMKQMSRYLEAMQKQFAGLVNLTFPED